MSDTATQPHEMTEHLAITVHSSGQEVPRDVLELEARGQLHILQNLTPMLRTAAKRDIARRSAGLDLSGNHQTPEHRLVPPTHGYYRLSNARQAAEELGVSERWERDHATRISPQVRAVIDKRQSTTERKYWTVSVEPLRLSLIRAFEGCAGSRIVVTADFECSGGIDDL